MFDVVALGELLIDFTPAGTSPNGNVLFERNPGGAPANVLACLAKLGRRTGLIGKVGEDQLGRFLRGVLADNGIAIQGLIMDREVNTTLAFVHLAADGDRSFSFYRKPGADTQLRPEEVAKGLLNTRIFHFGSLSLTDEPARSATLFAIEEAKQKGALISYDPNLRPPLWLDLTEAKRQMLAVMNQPDVVKLSEEELEFLTGTKDLASGSEHLAKEYNLPMVFVTLGADGCFYRAGTITGHVPGFRVHSIDTTGAGDGFVGGMLHQILLRNKKLSQWTQAELTESVRFANAIGALVTTKKGAIPAMPSPGEIEELLIGD